MDRIEKLQAYLAAAPADSFLKHALALEFVKIGRDESALPLFLEILEADPGYTGSYYHLGKLLERINQPDQAVSWYERGLKACEAAGDRHAYNELRGAYEELIF